MHTGDAGYLDDADYLILKADRGSVPGGLPLLIEHLHEAGGRLLIQP
jgi:hypothetical protein